MEIDAQSIIDLLIPGQTPGIKGPIVDVSGRSDPEILFFGPDEVGRAFRFLTIILPLGQLSLPFRPRCPSSMTFPHVSLRTWRRAYYRTLRT